MKTCLLNIISRWIRRIENVGQKQLDEVGGSLNAVAQFQLGLDLAEGSNKLLIDLYSSKSFKSKYEIIICLNREAKYRKEKYLYVNLLVFEGETEWLIEIRRCCCTINRLVGLPLDILQMACNLLQHNCMELRLGVQCKLQDARKNSWGSTKKSSQVFCLENFIVK